MLCSAEIEDDNLTVCDDCGSDSFAYGDVFITDEKLICGCHHDRFSKELHIDYTERSLTTYSCEICGSNIIIEQFREPRSPWDDFDYPEESEYKN